MINYGQIYEVWTNTATPSKTTARMTRTTLKYVATAHGTDDWHLMPALPLDHAMVLLDTAMASQDLVSQSRSNYRGYLRRLYRFMDQNGIHAATDDETRMWPCIPVNETGIEKRAQRAYQKFVKWAICAGVWPHTVKPSDILAWALSEKGNLNKHWRQEFRRLIPAWDQLGSICQLKSSEFPSLPPPKNSKYALPVSAWPTHLRIQWEGMCKQASDFLRKGAMRPWRDVTKKYYEARLCLFLGWFATIDSRKIEESDRWAGLLSADNCRDYLNWLVARSGNGHLNPGHPAFLRMVRGLHRFLLGSSKATIDEFNDLAKRCDVVGRDKAVRMVPYADLERGLRTALEAVTKKREGVAGKSKASLQVDVIIFGLLTTRGLRSLNIREIRIGGNLVETAGGYLLRFSEAEMKGHRAFETTIPSEIAQVIKDYLRTGYAKLASRPACEGDHLLLTRAGRPFGGGTFGQRVRRIAQKYIGKRLHPHIFRHIIATHAAQCMKLTPTELAAFLAHRSPMTVMQFYEVTSPSLAAIRFDDLRN